MRNILSAGTTFDARGEAMGRFADLLRAADHREAAG
jgi:hypothetical protein